MILTIYAMIDTAKVAPAAKEGVAGGGALEKSSSRSEMVVSSPLSGLYIGEASYYDYDLRRDDQECKSDDCYSMWNLTCASRDFSRGDILLVERINGLASTTCRVNDYGPEECPAEKLDCYLKDRIIDLSSYTFKQLGSLSEGIINVKVKKYEQPI